MRAFCKLLTAIAFIAFGSISVWSQTIKLIDPADVVSRAVTLYDSGKYAEAIAELETIPERDTAYAQILSKLAYTFVENKDFDKAIEVCRKALKSPSKERATFLKIEAIATGKKGDYQQAVALFENAIKEYPTNLSLIFNLGLMQYNNKDYQNAEANFFRILGINPFHMAAHLNLGKLAIGQGRKVHGMLAMGMYLGVNEKDNQSLVLLNNFVDNQVTDEGTLPVFGPNAPVKLDQMIRARIAVEEGFKSKFAVKAPVIQQFELLFDQLNTIPQSTDDRYVNFYLPIYKAIKESNASEAFMYHLLSSSSIEAAAKWRNKNEKDLKVFYNATNTALKKGRENIVVAQLGFNEPINAWYNNNNELVAIGSYSNEKKQGKWIYLHTNSEKSAEGSYNDAGEKKGTWKYFYETGKVKSIENYETGDVTVYTEKGNKDEHFFLKNDEIEGDVEMFYGSGPVREKLKFTAGKRDGKRTVYFGNGTVKTTCYYKSGALEGEFVVNYETGKISERGSYKNNELDGKYESFHTTGVTGVTGSYTNGAQTGHWKYYYSNGKPQRTGSYNEKGSPVGEWVYYDQRGEMVEKRNFNSDGQYHGDVSYYDNGKLFCTATYKKDVLVKDVFYDETGKVTFTAGGGDGSFHSKNYFSTGQLRSEGNYKKGKSEGPWKFYSRYGVVISDYVYKDNLLEGRAKDYYPSGEIKIEADYKDGELHGYFREFYKNGKVKTEGWYQNGNREQQWLTYHPDGTLASDFYYRANVNVGKGSEFAPDGKKFVDIEVDDEGGIAGLQYFTPQGTVGTVKRKENSIDVYEEFYKNKRLKSRTGVLCGAYSGTLERYFPDGTLHYQYEILNGKKNGKYTNYWFNGTLFTSGSYSNDQLTGVWKTNHENGKLYSEGRYLDDERDSLWTYYYNNGNMSSRVWYRGGERNGVTTYYGPDGTALVEKMYRQGDIIAYRSVVDGADAKWIPFTGNGKIAINYANGNNAFVEEFKNGLQHGYDRVYYPDGKLFAEYQYNNGDLTGAYKAYHTNGKLKESGLFQDDERNGKFEFYAENGTLERVETYSMGHQHGKAIVYNKGVKQKELNFWNRVAVD